MKATSQAFLEDFQPSVNLLLHLVFYRDASCVLQVVLFFVNCLLAACMRLASCVSSFSHSLDPIACSLPLHCGLCIVILILIVIAIVILIVIAIAIAI